MIYKNKRPIGETFLTTCNVSDLNKLTAQKQYPCVAVDC